MKKVIICFALVLSCAVFVWGSSIIKCEILTFNHKNEFFDKYKQTNMINSSDYLKILKYNPYEAEVYYVSKYKSGNLIYFEKVDELWVIKTWKTVWSDTGSADGFIWPYIR